MLPTDFEVAGRQAECLQTTSKSLAGRLSASKPHFSSVGSRKSGHLGGKLQSACASSASEPPHRRQEGTRPASVRLQCRLEAGHLLQNHRQCRWRHSKCLEVACTERYRADGPARMSTARFTGPSAGDGSQRKTALSARGAGRACARAEKTKVRIRVVAGFEICAARSV